MGSRMIPEYTKVKQQVLYSLFQGYIQNGGVPIFNVSEIIRNHGFSLTEVGNYLVQNRFVKNEVFKAKDFFASITMKGIKEIDPIFFDAQVSKIIATLLMNGNKKASVMEILDFEPKDFQIAVDISKAFEEIGFSDVEIKEDDVFVVLNPKGWEHYKGTKLNEI